MPGCVDKANAMTGIGEQGGTRWHGGEMSAFAFDAQVFLNPAVPGEQAHQRLRLMGVELIRNKDSGGVWMVWMVWAMCAAKSSSVRLGPIVGGNDLA